MRKSTRDFRIINLRKMQIQKVMCLSNLIIFYLTFIIILTGVYFCTANDIKELSSMKSETQIRKMIPCLVHCKRIKENRGNPVKMIRYCLINNNWLRLHFSVCHIAFKRENKYFIVKRAHFLNDKKDWRSFTLAPLSNHLNCLSVHMDICSCFTCLSVH